MPAQRKIVFLIGSFLLLVSLVPGSDSKEGKLYMPSQVPINIKPASIDGTLLGVGFNLLGVTTEWKDDFFGADEDIGELETKAKNLVVGLIRNKSEKYSVEWDLILGKLDLSQKTGSYDSSALGRKVNVSADGSGFDIGVRYLGGYSFHKTQLKGDKVVDWNLALSLHLALYRLGSTYKALSLDGEYANNYDSTEVGIFCRPLVALQPIIKLYKGVSIVPYVGASSMLIMGTESWEDTRYRTGGTEWDSSQFGEDTEFYFSLRGLEAIFGFDIGFISPFSREHQFTLGGAISKLFGGNDGDFSELHVLYAVPFSLSKPSK